MHVYEKRHPAYAIRHNLHMQSKNRCLRVSDDVWDKWQGQAKAWGLSLVRALEAAMAASGEEFPDSGMKAWVTTPAKKKPANVVEKKGTLKTSVNLPMVEVIRNPGRPNETRSIQKAPVDFIGERMTGTKAHPAVVIREVACDHAGTEIGRLSGVGACPKCGQMVTKGLVKK